MVSPAGKRHVSWVKDQLTGVVGKAGSISRVD
jgi:hypothetical protein